MPCRKPAAPVEIASLDIETPHVREADGQGCRRSGFHRAGGCHAIARSQLHADRPNNGWPPDQLDLHVEKNPPVGASVSVEQGRPSAINADRPQVHPPYRQGARDGGASLGHSCPVSMIWPRSRRRLGLRLAWLSISSSSRRAGSEPAAPFNRGQAGPFPGRPGASRRRRPSALKRLQRFLNHRDGRSRCRPVRPWSTPRSTSKEMFRSSRPAVRKPRRFPPDALRTTGRLRLPQARRRSRHRPLRRGLWPSQAGRATCAASKPGLTGRLAWRATMSASRRHPVVNTAHLAQPATPDPSAHQGGVGGIDRLQPALSLEAAVQDVERFEPATSVAPPKAPGSAAQPSASAQIALQIVRSLPKGIDRLSLHLHPAELGSVDIRLDFEGSGRMTAMITAERPETLELLQRDSRFLERSLGDNGLKLANDGLSFSLKQDQPGQQQGQSFPRSGPVPPGRSPGRPRL